MSDRSLRKLRNQERQVDLLIELLAMRAPHHSMMNAILSCSGQ